MQKSATEVSQERFDNIMDETHDFDDNKKYYLVFHFVS